MLSLAVLGSIKVGDRIRFRSPTRSSDEQVWRKVVGLDPFRVRFQGWSEFQVHDDEISDHEKGRQKKPG